MTWREIDRVREYAKETEGSRTELLAATVYHSTLHTNELQDKCRCPTEGRMAKVSFMTTVGLLSAMIRSEVMLFVGKTDAARAKWIKSVSENKYCVLFSHSWVLDFIDL